LRRKWEGGELSKGEARLSVSARRRRGDIGDNPRRARTETAPRGEAKKLRERLGTGRGERAARGRRP